MWSQDSSSERIKMNENLLSWLLIYKIKPVSKDSRLNLKLWQRVPLRCCERNFQNSFFMLCGPTDTIPSRKSSPSCVMSSPPPSRGWTRLQASLLFEIRAFNKIAQLKQTPEIRITTLLGELKLESHDDVYVQVSCPHFGPHFTSCTPQDHSHICTFF